MPKRVLVVVFLLVATSMFAAERQPQAPLQAVAVLHVEGQAIDVYSWSWGATQAVDRSATGGGAGKVQLQDFHFTKPVDKSSANLFEACATGKHFPSVTLVARKAGEGQKEFMVVKMSEVFVSSYQTGAASDSTMPTETIAISYGKIQFVVNGQ